MKRGQPWGFNLTDALLAEVGNVPLDALHRDAGAIVKAYEAIVPVAERLGVAAPKPRLAGFSYCHVSALGCEVVFPRGSEPNVRPVIETPEDIDALREPADYLTAGCIPERLRVAEELMKRRPDASPSIGMHPEGPLTTCVLLMGERFLTLPYEDPVRAHRLLDFAVASGLNFLDSARRYYGEPDEPRPYGIADDFAGMFAPPLFAEYVVPAWNLTYDGARASWRRLHSELLQKDHLPFLEPLHIGEFDPSADQYVTPELLREHCPVPFTARILTWEIVNGTPDSLQTMYRRYAACEPVRITFQMKSLEEEENCAALLEVARELE